MTIQSPPLLKGLPLIGHAHKMLRDPYPFFVNAYREHGAVFRLKLANREPVVLCGVEANQWFAKMDGDVLSSDKLFGDFAREVNTNNLMTAKDGDEHKYLRKMQKHGFSRGAVSPYFDELATLAEEQAIQWSEMGTISVFHEMQRLIADQLGVALANSRATEHFDAIRTYLNTLLNVHAVKWWPRIMLKRPKYRKAEAAVYKFAEEVLEAQRQRPSQDNLLSAILDAKDVRGQPFTKQEKLFATLGPFFAGMDTAASTLAFMLYAVTKHRDVKEQITAEVNEHFAEGIPSWHELPRKMPTLFGATLETLRMYPATPFTTRGVKKTFEFDGYVVEEGRELLLVNVLPHFLPECYPEPERFDVTRYHAPRNEHRQGLGVFAPYTVGPHTCLGAGLAESLVMISAGMILKTVDLELPSPDYTIKSRMIPTPAPRSTFVLRVRPH